MRRVKWSDQYQVHLPEIDAEHRSLYRATAELQHVVETGLGTEHIAAIMQEILTHLAGHFAHEERLMQETEFAGAAWHKQQHDTARRRVGALDARIRAGEEGAPAELVAYLAKWLRDHVGLADRMMASHLRNWERLHVAMAS